MKDSTKDLVESASTILIIQADNPDSDSLGSALALESIFGSMGKQSHLYCGVDMPGYIKYMKGWQRVSSELPSSYDLGIIVDASTMTLLEKLSSSGRQGWISSKPLLVLDHHHSVENVIPFATEIINDISVSSTGELIYKIAKELNWPIDTEAGQYIMSAILGDTQGLTNTLTTPKTYRIMAELSELGVNRSTLEEERREFSKMPLDIFKYKADLILRSQFELDGKLAIVEIPHGEIMSYSPLYNPAPLIQNDMLQTAGVCVAVVVKCYRDGKVLGSIRSNPRYPIADKIADRFGGGGHKHASGFKLTDGKPYDEIKKECISEASELLDKIEQDTHDEAIQYTYTTD